MHMVTSLYLSSIILSGIFTLMDKTWDLKNPLSLWMQLIVHRLKHYLYFDGKREKQETKENGYLQKMQNTVNTENTVPRKKENIISHLKSFPSSEINLNFDLTLPFSVSKKTWPLYLDSNTTTDFENLGYHYAKRGCLDKMHLFNELTCFPFRSQMN